MKASELIKQLQELTSKVGDLDLDLWQDEADDAGAIGGIAIYCDDNDKPKSFTVCGPNTLDAFADGEELH
jgi:hypothetical protein